MIAKCPIHGLVFDVIVVKDELTGKEHKFCGHCVKEKLLRSMYSGKIPTTTAEGAY